MCGITGVPHPRPWNSRPGPKRFPEHSPREKKGGEWGSRGVPINCKLAPVHRQEVPSIRVPRRTGASIGCSRECLNPFPARSPLCCWWGGFALGSPLLPLPRVTLTWVAPVPPSPSSLFPKDIPLSVSPAVPVLPLVSVSFPRSVSPPVSLSWPLPVSLPVSLSAAAAWRSLPGRGTRTGRRESAVGRATGRAAGWAGWARGRHRGGQGRAHLGGSE